MTLGILGFSFFALFFIFIGLLLAPVVSIDDWMYTKYTKRAEADVRQTIRDELMGLGVIDDDKAK